MFFLETMVLTLDEHDPESPIKPLPMHKQYLRDLAELFLSEQLLIVEKSRQMMVTWIMIACHLWEAMFHKGKRIFFQSKKEFDANNLVDRAKFIYRHLPAVTQKLFPANMPMAYLRLEFGKHDSVIQGTPQGDSVLRQYTASRIFSDEMAFQEEAEEAYIAAKPTIVGGGRFVGVSSPNFENFFYRLKADEL